jgi:hypothetical protein
MVVLAAINNNIVYASDGTITLQQTALTYSSSESTSKPEDEKETKETSTSLNTMPNSLSIQASWDNISIYIFPTSPGNPLSISYMVLNELELGLNIGFEASKKSRQTSSNNSFGFFGFYYVEVGPGVIETGLAFDTNSNTSKTTSVDTETKTSRIEKTSESSATTLLTTDFVYAINKRFSYFGGVSYTIATKTDNENKVKTTENMFGLNIASFRFAW